MQTRARLYELLDYEAYNIFDTSSSTSRARSTLSSAGTNPCRTLTPSPADPTTRHEGVTMSTRRPCSAQRSARVSPASSSTTPPISKVNPDTNSLLYRGYPVQELAAQLHLRGGRLPALARRAADDEHELAEFETPRALAAPPRPARQARHRRAADHGTPHGRRAHRGQRHRRARSRMPPTRRPLRTSTSRSACSRSCPSIVAYDQRRRRGQELVEPRDDLGYSANFLLHDLRRGAELGRREAFDVSMILYAEHSFNASTFTARVVTSTLCRPVLGGRRRRSARSRVRCTAARTRPSWTSSTRSARPTKAERGSTQALAEKRKIMGFGHRVYKNGDSRVPTMKAALDTLVEHYERPDLLAPLRRARERRCRAQGHPAEPRLPERPGLPPDRLRHADVHAAVRGGAGDRLDRARHGAVEANALIRPLSDYVGVEQREVEYVFHGLAARCATTAEHHLRRSREVADRLRIDGDPTVWQVASELTWTAGWPNLNGFYLLSALAQTAMHLEFVRSDASARYLG